jgi:hypothetical protein
MTSFLPDMAAAALVPLFQAHPMGAALFLASLWLLLRR